MLTNNLDEVDKFPRETQTTEKDSGSGGTSRMTNNK